MTDDRTDAVPDDATGQASLPHRLDASSASLWAAAVAFYGVGDTATTVVGIHWGHAAEAGPVMATVLDGAGLGGVVVTKLLTLLGFYLLWRAVTSPGRVGVPLALGVVGIAVTCWNTVVLLPL